MRTLQIDSREEIEQIIRSCKICFVAMCDSDSPYVLPMNFGLDGDTVILHSAQKGRMWEILRRNPKVCITWSAGDEINWQNSHVACSYYLKSSSVVAEGVAELIDDYDQKVKCMELFMSHYSPLTFRFNKPAIINVGIIRVKADYFSGRKFGEKAGVAGRKP